MGGYASSTIIGLNTRKYHGLLVAALHPPGDRTVCLSKLDEDIFVGSDVFRLGANEFIDGFFPSGHVFLKEFHLTPLPKYVYVAGDLTLEKTLFMPNEKNAVIANYKLTNKNNVNVKVRIFPLVTCRGFHSVVDTEFSSLNLLQEMHDESSVELKFQDPKATITLTASNVAFVENPNLVRRLLYREEARRGESSLDDCYQPGYFEITASPGATSEFAIVAAADENPQQSEMIANSISKSKSDQKKSIEAELNQKAAFLAGFLDSQRYSHVTDWLPWILLASDSFVVSGKPNSLSVIAGYHWFEVWGRDTFVSLPGLMLVTGRFSDAEKALIRFAGHVKQGLIPNFLSDSSGEPTYDTVDATLWYVNAVLQYLKYTGDFRFVEENLWQPLKDIVESHERGTANGIHLDSDGLLMHGPRLTWMDAEVNYKPVTPRTGKAVEIQALWYNALRTVQLLAERFGHKTLAWRCSDMSAKARESFDREFWNKNKTCLFDLIDASGADSSVRPNQVFATALDFPILYQDKSEAVIDVVQRDLLTPCGLRTLALGDPRYHGKCEGNRQSRDEAYHNGTVWPWLLGPYTTAYIKVKGNEPESREFALTNLIEPLFSKQLFKAGLGTVSEIFDGDPPHKPRGCISQAWSIAEPMRAYVEDVLQVRPKHEKSVLRL